jgi:hypothetical protein
MADEKEIEGSDLGAIVANELRSSKRYAETELKDKRTLAIEYLHGTMRDVPARPNGSSVISRDLSDTMSWILPGVMRVFTASDQMVIYEPETQQDEEFAKQATDYANYVFFRDNNGYRTLYNATHDSLALGNGIVRHYWDPTPKTDISSHTRLSGEQLALMMQDPDVEILTGNENEQPDLVPVADPQTGQMMQVPVKTYDVKVQRTKSRGKVCVEACKPENFFLDSEATTIEEARFVAYLHDSMTRSDLMEMAGYYGWDRQEIEDLSADSIMIQDEEGLARDREAITFSANTLKSTQLIDLYICYVKADVDDDGIAETVQVWYAGDSGAGKVLGWDVYEDELPFSDIPCYPVPHRWDAESVADRTMDVQRIKTVLLRQSLDNIYAHNLPMREVEANSVLNPDILVNPKFGGIIWRKAGSNPIVPHAVPFVADKSFQAMDYMDMVIAKRTGVSRTTMALDPEALQNQTATASQNQRDAGYSQIELIARNMAELGWRRVFRQVLKLSVKHQDRPRTIRLRDKWVEMDPRSWNAGMDATINVGLGTGSRDRDMQMLGQVLNTQMMMADRFMAAGAQAEAIEMLPKITNTLVRMAESAGLKNPEDYYPEFAAEKVAALKQMAADAANKPDPQAELKKMEIEASGQIEQQKIIAHAEAEKMKAQGNVVKERAQMEADLQVKDAELRNATEIEGVKIASAERIEFARLQFEASKLYATMALEREKMANAANVAASRQQSKPAPKPEPGPTP